MKIVHKQGNELDIDQVIELYIASTLGKRRPVDDKERMALMIKNASIVITAWDGDLLVGIARSLSDMTYVTYLADLAVRETYQKQGIGKELIKKTREKAGLNSRLVLLSAPAAVGYYPHIGFTKHEST